jgi:hypothetical protein
MLTPNLDDLLTTDLLTNDLLTCSCPKQLQYKCATQPVSNSIPSVDVHIKKGTNPSG